ncbi:nucleoside diphosphate-linked moiety X motif 17 isoform 2-T2 [Alca torda]
MAGTARVMVHVRRGGAGAPARFGQEDVAVVSCGLDRGRFLLSDVAFPSSTPALLKRPSFCPAKLLGEQEAAAIPAELRGRGVAAGVAVLLRASTGHILLTRRAPTLSIFPGLWVPPGGHVEPGEELLDVGLRELEEETGLRLEAGTFSWRMLGLWESIYPPMLSRGLPRRHHIVTYLLLLCQEPHQRLEVSAGLGTMSQCVPTGGDPSAKCQVGDNIQVCPRGLALLLSILTGDIILVCPRGGIPRPSAELGTLSQCVLGVDPSPECQVGDIVLLSPWGVIPLPSAGLGTMSRCVLRGDPSPEHWVGDNVPPCPRGRSLP